MARPFDVRAEWVLPIADEHFSEIGRLAAYWSQVEYALQRIIWQLVPMSDPARRALTAAQRAETHVEIIKLLKESDLCTDIEVRDALGAVLDRLVKLREDRNRIVHALWVIDPQTRQPLVMRTRVKDLGTKVPYAPAEIRAVGDQVDRLWQDMNNLLEHMQGR